ncbi:hypothetical protein P171DRAFT_446852 [Karstenula rhodostoma CBS 690.94]|uniref:Cytochrome P450 n=1 Tax=Karstenula rhodostoma CBS 690.94 TaxID=1392251 RepID=A0A9P4U974_9PLEO|nr:hypothetical protein P171DRAFT_446852 [Karstenula rhodostoma CBS 690.94]
MAITRALFHCVGSTLSLSTVPVLATIAVGAKVFYFAPLLFRWNFPLSEIPGPGFMSLTLLDTLRCDDSKLTPEYLDGIQQKFGSVARVGFRHVVISDTEIIQQLLDKQEQYFDQGNGLGRMVVMSDTYIRGYRIPKGTIITLNHPSLASIGKS